MDLIEAEVGEVAQVIAARRPGEPVDAARAAGLQIVVDMLEEGASVVEVLAKTHATREWFLNRERADEDEEDEAAPPARNGHDPTEEQRMKQTDQQKVDALAAWLSGLTGRHERDLHGEIHRWLTKLKTSIDDNEGDAIETLANLAPAWRELCPEIKSPVFAIDTIVAQVETMANTPLDQRPN